MEDRPAHRLNGDKLRKLRIERGFVSQSALARKIRVRASTVQRWESGDTTPDGTALADLCRVLQTTPDYLFDRGSMPSEKRELLTKIRAVFGRSVGDAVEHLEALTDHHRSIVSGRLLGWCEALRMVEREQAGENLPPTRYDEERAEAALSAAEPVAATKPKPAGGKAA